MFILTFCSALLCMYVLYVFFPPFFVRFHANYHITLCVVPFVFGGSTDGVCAVYNMHKSALSVDRACFCFFNLVCFNYMSLIISFFFIYVMYLASICYTKEK